jgi:hypothetical protein
VKAARTPDIFRALDEARFGAARTLDLHDHHPTREEAVRRAENWLRERQMSRATEALVITGRGNRSPDGVSVVREAIVKLFASLHRRGVLASVSEHTPGSFVVTFAPLGAVRNAARRARHPQEAPPRDPAALAALAPETRALLRRLAQRSIEELGMRRPAGFIEEEMVAQFSAAAAGVPDGPDREARLRAALEAALAEYDDR